jgi:hypothetical protein
MNTMRMKTLPAWLILISLTTWVMPGEAQVRGTRRRTVVKGEEGKGAAAGPRGVAVKGEEGYASAGRRGAVVKGDEGYAAVGRRGVVVGNRYESYEAWRIAAGVGTAIAVGTMLARPPRAAVTVTYSGSSYWYEGGVYYTRVISGGTTVYQVVTPPAGIVITTLPVGCSSVRVGAVTYSQCGGTYYQRVGGGYRVVVL